MDLTLTAAALATLISATTSAAITLYINSNNKAKIIDDQLDTLLKIALQYPYLEDENFTKEWSKYKDLNKEEYLRYDVYCNLLFNFLSRVASHYKYNESKINNYIAIKEWVRVHRYNWEDPKVAYENIDSYDEKFKTLISKYLN